MTFELPLWTIVVVAILAAAFVLAAFASWLTRTPVPLDEEQARENARPLSHGVEVLPGESE